MVTFYTLTLISGEATGPADKTIGRISRNTLPGLGSLSDSSCASIALVKLSG